MSPSEYQNRGDEKKKRPVDKSSIPPRQEDTDPLETRLMAWVKTMIIRSSYVTLAALPRFETLFIYSDMV